MKITTVSQPETQLGNEFDGLLADSSPFSFYYLSVVITALLTRFGSAVLAVILGGLCGHFLWVVPRFSMDFLGTNQIAQIVVFIVVFLVYTALNRVL